MLLQYILRAANVPNAIMIARHRLPILSPITALLFAWGFLGMFKGLFRIQTAPGKKIDLPFLFSITFQSLRGLVYMLH
ncbi:MAG: hypothetical protein AAGE84_07170 [Cyanobacteria bacterium P01_G01_bin.39]